MINNNFVAGGIGQCHQAWSELTSDPDILDSVQGVKLDFFEDPVQDRLPHEIQFNKQEAEAVQNELEKFLELGIIRKSKINQGDFVSNLFARPKKDKNQVRLILNLKPLNRFINFIHFKMEGLQSALDLIRPGMVMASIDFVNSFYSVPVHPDHTKYLKCVCLGEVYEFLCLPMGYSQSPLHFCKLLKVPLSELRRKYGHTITSFVDDLLLLEDTPAELVTSIRHSIDLLQNLGYTINARKSELVPTTRICYLGFWLDSIEMSIAMTEEKALKLKDLGLKILNLRHVEIRSFASLVGQMIAALPAVKFGAVHVKTLEISKNKALMSNNRDFSCFMDVSDWDAVDIRWWCDHIVGAKRLLTPLPITKTIFSDASTEGYGFFDQDENRRVGGRWSEAEKSHHINWLEIVAAHIALRACCADLHDCHIKLFLDSQVAIACIRNSGSTKSLPCQAATRKLILFCEAHNLDISLQYIKSEDNKQADTASRVFKNPDTEWSLDIKVFNKLLSIFQVTPDIDMFASRLNNKVEKFCSWEWEPGCSFTDALHVDWNMFTCIYAFPPFSIIGATIRKFRESRTQRLLLIIPDWPTQPYYTQALRQVIHRPVVIKVKNKTLRLSHDSSVKHPMAGKLRLLALLLSNNDIEIEGFLSLFPTLWRGHDAQRLTSNTPLITPDGGHIASRGRWIPTLPLFRNVRDS